MAATDKETIILDLKVDQGSAISELERTKKSIIGLKEEQQQLTKAYKAGEIAVDEYASESVRLEAILKKNQAEYNNIQKSVTGVKTQMDKLIDSNKKISAEFQNAANNIRVAGVSLGDVTTKLSAFANPATAAVGIVTALGAAYARSTIGARDLEFAQNQLSAATTIVTDSFARLVSSGEDGEGIISIFTSAILFKLSPALAVMAQASADAIENLEDVQRNAALVQSGVNERLAENADLRTDIANQELSAADRLNAAQKVLDNITQNTLDKLASINAQIDARNRIVEDAEVKEDAINLLIAERSALTASESREKSKIEKQINAINRGENERLEIIRRQQEVQGNRINRGLSGTDSTEFGAQGGVGGIVEQERVNVNNLDDLMRESAARTKALRDKETDEIIAAQELRFATTAAYTSALTTLAITAFGENSAIAKATGIADAIVNTYTGATLALRSAPPPLSFALAALTIANGLASVAQISRAAGGGDFVTRGPALMMVGDNPGGRERVTVEPLSGRGRTHVAGNMVAMAGGGTLTTGFDDGGISKNGAVAQMDQVLMLSNTMKNLPPAEVSVVEISNVMNRVQVKQSVAKA